MVEHGLFQFWIILNASSTHACNCEAGFHQQVGAQSEAKWREVDTFLAGNSEHDLQPTSRIIKMKYTKYPYESHKPL